MDVTLAIIGMGMGLVFGAGLLWTECKIAPHNLIIALRNNCKKCGHSIFDHADGHCNKTTRREIETDEYGLMSKQAYRCSCNIGAATLLEDYWLRRGERKQAQRTLRAEQRAKQRVAKLLESLPTEKDALQEVLHSKG